MSELEKLPDTWESLITLVSQTITLRKFSEGSYDEDWDEGAGQGTSYTIQARVKYDLTEREITELGENMLLDAVVVIRMTDLEAQSLDVASQDRFVIALKSFRITKFRSVVIAGVKVGYEIGVREETSGLPDPPPPPGGNGGTA